MGTLYKRQKCIVWKAGTTDSKGDYDAAWHSRGVSPGSPAWSVSLSLYVCWLQSGQLGKGAEVARRPRLGRGLADFPGFPIPRVGRPTFTFWQAVVFPEAGLGGFQVGNPFCTTPMVITVQRGGPEPGTSNTRTEKTRHAFDLYLYLHGLCGKTKEKKQGEELV